MFKQYHKWVLHFIFLSCLLSQNDIGSFKLTKNTTLHNKPIPESRSSRIAKANSWAMVYDSTRNGMVYISWMGKSGWANINDIDIPTDIRNKLLNITKPKAVVSTKAKDEPKKNSTGKKEKASPPKSSKPILFRIIPNTAPNNIANNIF